MAFFLCACFLTNVYNPKCMSIQYSLCDALRITTFTKNEKPPFFVPIPNGDLAVSNNKPLLLLAADDIPFVFYVKGRNMFGAMAISKQDTFDEKLLHTMKALIENKNLNVKDVYCYLGPSLTFSHVEISREALLSLIQKGYRSAAKRTSGVDYADLPVMNVVMLRKIGIPFQNIHIDGYDTYEASALLYSKHRGDEKKNPTLVELVQKSHFKLEP